MKVEDYQLSTHTKIKKGVDLKQSYLEIYTTVTSSFNNNKQSYLEIYTTVTSSFNNSTWQQNQISNRMYKHSCWKRYIILACCKQEKLYWFKFGFYFCFSTRLDLVCIIKHITGVPLPSLDLGIWLVNVMGEYFANEVVQCCRKRHKIDATITCESKLPIFIIPFLIEYNCSPTEKKTATRVQVVTASQVQSITGKF